MRRIRRLRRGTREAAPLARRAAGSLALVSLLVAPLPVLADAAAGSEKPGGVVAVAPAALTGLAVDALGRSLEGVEIRLHTTEPGTGRLTLHTAQTDRAGQFRFADLAPGTYRVIAVKGGYAVLVGQVNTLFENTLELVLRPAGQAARPGARPEDSSWVLRLPRRDPLEERDAQVVEAVRAEPSAGNVSLALPMTVELLASHTADGAGAGDAAGLGVSAGITSTFELADAGFLGLSFRHETAGEPDRSLDRADVLQARFVPNPFGSEVPVTVSLDAIRGRRDRTLEPLPGGLHVLSEGAALNASWTGTGSEGTVTATLDAAMFRAEQSGVDSGLLDVDPDLDDDSAALVAFEVRGRRSWGEGRETNYVASLRQVSGGALRGAARDGELALIPIISEIEAAVLDALDARSAGLMVENRWLAQRLGASMTSRVRMEHVGGVDDGLRAALSFGGDWRLPAGLSLEIDGGAAMNGRGEILPLWVAALGGGTERFLWSVAGRRETGVAPWRGSDGAWSDGVLPVMTDRDGDIRGVSASASWRQGERWPELKLLVERFVVEGRLAADLPGDLPWVPIDAQGDGSGVLVDLFVDSPRTGTSIGLGWSEVEDRGETRVLLSGSERWTWQQMKIRQRLGSDQRDGARWQLIIGVERGRATDATEGNPNDGRIALLSQRRVSGGVALAF